MLMMLMLGCQTAQKNNAPVCRVNFDLTDEGLFGLNITNKRAIKSFTEICGKGKKRK